MTRSSFLLKIYNFSPRLAIGGKTLTIVKPFSHKKGNTDKTSKQNQDWIRENERKKKSKKKKKKWNSSAEFIYINFLFRQKANNIIL